MLPLFTLLFGFLALLSLIVIVLYDSGVAAIVFVVCIAFTVGLGMESAKVISVTNTVTPGTVIKTPNAVIAEIRVGDRIERAIFTDIPTYQHATPQTRIIWRETETSWGKTGVIVLDL